MSLFVQIDTDFLTKTNKFLLLNVKRMSDRFWLSDEQDPELQCLLKVKEDLS